MEDKVSKELCRILMLTDGFTAVVGSRLTPRQADVKEGYPFALYQISNGRAVTMDGAKNYDVFISLVFESNGYAACLALKNVVQAALLGSPFFFQEDDGLSVTDNKEYVSVMRFECTAYPD